MKGCDFKMANNKNDKDIVEKLATRAFIFSAIGACTIGICPALGIMGIVIPCVLKSKNVPMSEEVKDKNKKSIILGIASLVMFVIDIGLICFAHSKLGWF